MTLGTEFWSAIAVVVAAIFAYFGVRYTAQQTNLATKRAEATEKEAVDAAAYERARESYESAIGRYLAEIDRLTVAVDGANQRLMSAYENNELLEQIKKDQRYEIDATVEKLIELRREHEVHLQECQRRLQRLRTRLLHDKTISPHDPDLFD